MQASNQLEVHLGENGIAIGKLYLNNRKRTGFSYYESWLQHPAFFDISPDLQPVLGIQYPQNIYFFALQDTAPDSWGERVIRRAYAKLRQTVKGLGSLQPADFLLWVDDEARMGALRLYDPEHKRYLHSEGQHRHIPPLVELRKVLKAVAALEAGSESDQDLQYLLGRGTSLGGARPKSTIRDIDGGLALGKYPSQADQRDVIRGEVLALNLAKQAGVNAATARVEVIADTAVAVIKRFDRTAKNARIPYLSAASLLQVSEREHDHAYSELVDALQRYGAMPVEDCQQLWRRLVFNFLICNTDDHLHNTGFLYDTKNKGWRLSPAFDLNPMPGNLRESKTWLTSESGPIYDKQQLLDAAAYFRLDEIQAKRVWQEVNTAVQNWKAEARPLGMSQSSMQDFAAAFLI